MAIIYAVRERTQSKIAMRKVMDYVAQDKKTVYGNENGQRCKLVSGYNCCGDTAFKEFMTTKRKYGKDTSTSMSNPSSRESMLLRRKSIKWAWSLPNTLKAMRCKSPPISTATTGTLTS